jgi:hypothetical protein
VQAVPATPAAPTEEAVRACNRQAAAEVGEQNKTKEIVKGAAIGGIVGAGGGTLYGLNENRQNDEKYRAAYSSCMRARGYTAG